jgi:hypothetical protein
LDSAGTPYLKNTCTFDGLNRTTRVNQQGQTGGSTVAEKRVDFSYNARGQFTSIARYKAVAGGTSNEVATSSFNYDTLERLTELAHKKGGSILFTLYSWTFDALSRVTGVTSCRKLATHAALCDCTRHNQARQGREIAGSVALRRVRFPLPGNTWEFWWASEYLDPPYFLASSSLGIRSREVTLDHYIDWLRRGASRLGGLFLSGPPIAHGFARIRLATPDGTTLSNFGSRSWPDGAASPRANLRDSR